jgi:CubicO group peptidase (beta-lactamase class C family)
MWCCRGIESQSFDTDYTNLRGFEGDTEIKMKSEFKFIATGLARRGLVLIASLFALLLMAPLIHAQSPGSDAATRVSSANFCPAVGDTNVTVLLTPIRNKFNVPAVCAAVVTSDGIQFVGAVGVRKRGTEIPVTLTDLWHFGSDTKAMTSVLIARLVERDRLKWNTTLAEVFPELASDMNPAFRKVTLLQLLSHHAGLPPNLDLASYRGDDVKALRLRAVREELAKEPKHAPGSTYEYSNLGYIIAGAVVEKVTGQSWEDAIRGEIFGPLKMETAGFGGTGTPGKIDQPWPHFANGDPAPANGPAMDNPPVMGPAGRVHGTIQDWAKFAQDQLRGARGEPALLKTETYRKLHTPPFAGDYALGWICVERSWGGGKVLNHVGDNTMNCANIWIAPERDFAILVCVNQGGQTAFRATDAAVGALIKLHKPPQTSK